MEIGTLIDPTLTSWEAKTEEIEKLRGAGDVTIFKSVGLGIQDVAIACKVVERAEDEGLGTRVPFDE